MDTLELIESAAKKVGGMRELSRQLNWNSGAIAGVKAGKRPLPAYRAAQIAKILGRDEDAAAWEALAAQAKGEEQAYWLAKIKKVRSDFAIICIAFLALFAGALPRAEAAITSVPAVGAEYTLCAHQAVVRRGLPDQTPRPFHAVQNPTLSDITSATDMSHAVSHIVDLLHFGASPCNP